MGEDGAMEFHVVDAASPGARLALTAYVEELVLRLPHHFTHFTPEGAVDAAATAFNAPLGVFVVVGDPDEPSAGGGVWFLDGNRAEVKRMWVRSTERGRGIAARLLGVLEDKALEAGRGTMVLDTNTALEDAVRLYRRSGYREVPDYNANPDADIWFEKSLSARPDSVPK